MENDTSRDFFVINNVGCVVCAVCVEVDRGCDERWEVFFLLVPSLPSFISEVLFCVDLVLLGGLVVVEQGGGR